MRILKTVLLFLIRLVILPVRLLLLVALCFWGVIGGFVETLTSILGFVMMATGVFCVIAKIMDAPVFVEMFLVGAGKLWSGFCADMSALPDDEDSLGSSCA